ncbi:hypothetical protein FRC05_006495 [Tulasnella sp. 425]|nr:hypothetical protein FRC05_006495 [Tulasnella sp. 425]
MRPSTGSTPSYLSHSTTYPARLTVSGSASTAPIYSSSPPAAFVPKSPLPATLPTTDPAAVFKRIAYLESTVSQLERDNARQLSETNALFENKIFPGMNGFAKERDAEKAARNLVEAQLAEEIASHAKTEEAIIKERKLHRQAERARLETFCVAPFLKSVCAAAKRVPNSKEGPELKQNQELATAAEAFDESDDGEGCSELVSDELPRALSTAPAPIQWFKNGSTGPKRFA